MKNKILIIIFVLISSLSFSQAKEYYDLLRIAERKIVINQLDSSLYYYNTAFDKYDYPFVRDVLAGACVAHYADDTAKLYHYLEVLLNRGMSVQELNYFVKKRPNDKKIQFYKNHFKEFQNRYLASIDKKVESAYRELDKRNQIDLSYARIKFGRGTPKYLEQREKDNNQLVEKYLSLVKKYGYFDEKKCGIGSGISIYWTNDKKNTFYQGLICELITKPDIREKENDSVFFMYSYIRRTSLTKYLNRRGNSFLWHINLDKYPQLDSIMKLELNQLQLYQNFYAACRERSREGMEDMEDYCIAWESKSKQKYSFDLKKIIQNADIESINKRRASIYIRTLQEDLELFEALQKLEGLKYKHYFKRKKKGNDLFFDALYTYIMP